MNSLRTVFIALAGACLAAAGAASAQYSNNRTVPMGATGVDTSHIKTKSRADPVVADQPTSLTGQVQVALDKLVLQRLGPGGDDHLAAGKQRGDGVGESLARAGAGLGEQRAARFDGVRHRFGHRQLLHAKAVGRKRERQRAVGPEDRSKVRRQALESAATPA